MCAPRHLILRILSAKLVPHLPHGEIHTQRKKQHGKQADEEDEENELEDEHRLMDSGFTPIPIGEKGKNDIPCDNHGKARHTQDGENGDA